MIVNLSYGMNHLGEGQIGLPFVATPDAGVAPAGGDGWLALRRRRVRHQAAAVVSE